ncbi:MAG: SAM-dependent methyltransferase [Saprospiraceae bacterium]|nr:SAM-dependent methyltransferase [Saprospiraceae bacterium]MCB9324143.1 SAM-dependent methyltransferase [Lewinellaceae bacterium]
MQQFLTFLKESLQGKTFVELTLANKRDKSNDLKLVIVKPVQTKKGDRLSFVYRYPTKDITKNFSWEESLEQLELLLNKDFLQAVAYTLKEDRHLTINSKNKTKITTKSPTKTEKPPLEHNRQKNRMIATEGNIYLHELGITTADWQVKNTKQDKYRQINKYVEIIDGVLKSTPLGPSYNVVDMGAGKGYLTFALYDYLYQTTGRNPNVIGVELRKELVEKCNIIAEKSSFPNLKFQEGTIIDAPLPDIDVLIALHACDTATDDAIYRGIKSGSQVIVCAPCCHKQIRKQIDPEDDLAQITRFGILKERQAEIITDAIRALFLEAYGYKTKVFEFIATEHTPKNILIVGTKQREMEEPDPEILQQIQNIKSTYGIEYHYLEKLLRE